MLALLIALGFTQVVNLPGRTWSFKEQYHNSSRLPRLGFWDRGRWREAEVQWLEKHGGGERVGGSRQPPLSARGASDSYALGRILGTVCL